MLRVNVELFYCSQTRTDYTMNENINNCLESLARTSLFFQLIQIQSPLDDLHSLIGLLCMCAKDREIFFFDRKAAHVNQA